MKILIVNIYFHPDPTGTGLVMTELAQDLVRQGHEVTVITSVPHYGSPLRVEGGELRVEGPARPGPGRSLNPQLSSLNRPVGGRATRIEMALWRESWLDGIRVIRTAVYVPRRKTIWSRVLNYVTFSAATILAGLRCGRQEVILCTSPPLPIGISAWLLSRLKRTPFVFNVQDIYPDAAVLMGVIRHPLLIASFRRLERFIYRRAALVTVISEGARQNLRSKGVPDRRIAVIPNWVDVEFVQPVSTDNAFRHAHGLGDAHVAMFAGNIGLIAGLETVLEAAAALRRRPDIRFLIVGEGNAKAELVAQAERMALTNVTFLPTQRREVLPEVLGAADVHLVTLKRRMSTTSVPSKSYGIMAAARAMVAAVDPGSEVWRLVQEADAGVCVPPEEPHELARAVESLCDDPERRRRLGENARAYVVAQNSRETLTARYGQILAAVATEEKPRDTGPGVNQKPTPRLSSTGVSTGGPAPTGPLTRPRLSRRSAVDEGSVE